MRAGRCLHCSVAVLGFKPMTTRLRSPLCPSAYRQRSSREHDYRSALISFRRGLTETALAASLVGNRHHERRVRADDGILEEGARSEVRRRAATRRIGRADETDVIAVGIFDNGILRTPERIERRLCRLVAQPDQLRVNPIDVVACCNAEGHDHAAAKASLS